MCARAPSTAAAALPLGIAQAAACLRALPVLLVQGVGRQALIAALGCTREGLVLVRVAAAAASVAVAREPVVVVATKDQADGDVEHDASACDNEHDCEARRAGQRAGACFGPQHTIPQEHGMTHAQGTHAQRTWIGWLTRENKEDTADRQLRGS